MVRVHRVRDSALIIVSCLLLSACPDDGDDDFACPSLNDSATFRSYGSYEFRNEGNDDTARKIISDCGWHVYQGHNGGAGATLQVASPDESIAFVWAFNSFRRFMLTKGWSGSVSGIRIGDHISTVYQKYPSFMPDSASRFHTLDASVSGGETVVVESDAGGFVSRIVVGTY